MVEIMGKANNNDYSRIKPIIIPKQCKKYRAHLNWNVDFNKTENCHVLLRLKYAQRKKRHFKAEEWIASQISTMTVLKWYCVENDKNCPWPLNRYYYYYHYLFCLFYRADPQSGANGAVAIFFAWNFPYNFTITILITKHRHANQSWLTSHKEGIDPPEKNVGLRSPVIMLALFQIPFRFTVKQTSCRSSLIRPFSAQIISLYIRLILWHPSSFFMPRVFSLIFCQIK